MDGILYLQSEKKFSIYSSKIQLSLLRIGMFLHEAYFSKQKKGLGFKRLIYFTNQLMVNNLYEIWPYNIRISIAQEAQSLQIIFHSIAQCKHKSLFYNVNTHPFDSLLTSTINCYLWQYNIQFSGTIQKNLSSNLILIIDILQD